MNGFNVNMSKKDIFNAKSGSLSIKTAEAAEWHTVSGCAVVEMVDLTGIRSHVILATYLPTSVYSGSRQRSA